MTEEEAKELKVGDRIKANATSTCPIWEIDQVQEKGVVIFITGYNYKSHLGLLDWPRLKNYVKL